MKITMRWGQLFILIIAICQSIGTECPRYCECYYIASLLQIDCSNNFMQELPPDLNEDVRGLDLSGNSFTTIPSDISSYRNLIKLDISRNQITYINPLSLYGLDNLLFLDLSNNNISSWSDINPKSILISLKSIRKLIFSNNKLGPLRLNLEDNLQSGTLEELVLSNCGIPSGELNINGLSALKALVLNNNPIRKFKISSPTLEILDLSYCELTRLSQAGLNSLPRLRYLCVSHNYYLEISKSYPLISPSLKEFDASFCNMNRISLTKTPNITKVNLRSNMLHITGDEFGNNSKLEYLDLSSNAIETIHRNSFTEMTSLQFLNLSINDIRDVHDLSFSKLTNLTTLLLSQNHISYLGNLHSDSITKLDLSRCEIMEVSSDIFKNMHSILRVSLSKNFIRTIPSIHSNTLQMIDLSYNRITSIDDSTFQFLPNLMTLYLSDNKFTATFTISNFENNTKLTEISLSDNAWRCDCYDPEMKYFFFYISYEPPKIRDMNSLICQSPSNVTDYTWLKACYNTWNPQTSYQTQRAMNFLIATLGAFILCFIILYMIKNGMKKRLLAEEEVRRREAAETRERLRQMEIANEQQELLNAPDPRDLVSPPSYSEALLMPKLDRSFNSLSNLNPNKKKRTRRRTKSSGDLLEEARSEENNNRRGKPDDGTTNRRYKRTQSTSNIDNDIDIESDNTEEQSSVRVVHESDL